MMTLWKSLLLVFAFVLLSTTAQGSDGAIEINQARALAGGVTAGDTPGFPVTLSAPGSYVLTGNLTVSDVAVTGIQVASIDVSIDLHGFAIQGPVVCSGSGLSMTCAPAGTGNGIHAAGRARIQIERGTVRGFGNTGIYTGERARIEALYVESNGVGMIVGDNSEISRTTAYQNQGSGIYAYPGCVLSHNIARSNKSDGIYSSSGASIVGNTALYNGSAGIRAGNGSVVRDNATRLNEAQGISVSAGSVVSDNTATYNLTAGIYAGSGSNVQRNTTAYNSTIGLDLGAQAGYRENVIYSNTTGTVSGGVNLGNNLCNGVVCP